MGENISFYWHNYTAYTNTGYGENIEFYVYWTVHHLDSWTKRDQLDVTCIIISLFDAQHVSDVNTSILRSLRLICWVISWIILPWFDVCWCYVVVWLGWCGIRMQAEPAEPPRSPDLNPLHFYLWEPLKSYGIQLQLKTKLHPTNAFLMSVKPFVTTPGTFQKVRQSMTRHVQARIDLGAGYFEHLLRTVTWYTIITQQILNWDRVLELYCVSCK